MTNLVLAKITETNPQYVAEMIAYFNLQEVKKGYVKAPLDVIQAIHGLEIATDENQLEPSIASFLDSYAGHNNFMLSVKTQYLNGRILSPKQIEVIKKFMIPAEKAPTPVYTLKVGQVVRVGSTYGRKVYRDLGFNKPIFNMEITDIDGETQKAWKVKVKGSAVANGYCGCCGRLLTDPISIDSNVGPICAEQWGISWGDSGLSRKEIAAKLETVATSNFFWLPKSVVKEIV